MYRIVHNLMRTIATGIALAAVPVTLTSHEGPARADVHVSVHASADFPTFHAALAPYGRWIHHAGGLVWVPSKRVVGVHFRPYGSGGHWVLTDQGWYFESAWAWGAIPFHYGRWA